MQKCPHCDRENADVDAYCYGCGHILLSVLQIEGATRKLEDVFEALEPRRRWGTAYFDHRSQLRLSFTDPVAVLTLPLEDKLVLGRAHAEPDVPQPDVDLTSYCAVEKGVSRIHLQLSRDYDTISVTDLGSANHTYLNGQRLLPHEARILRDSDELRLGRMVVRVAFT